jgi:hypothetical protein
VVADTTMTIVRMLVVRAELRDLPRRVSIASDVRGGGGVERWNGNSRVIDE